MSLKIINAVVVIILVASSLVIFANSMTKPIGHDEHMYCTAGALMAQGKMIYKDFSYVAQMPYHPILLAGLYKLFNTTHYLLTARLFSAVCDILTAACILLIYRRVFKSFPFSGIFLGLAAILLYVFNPFVYYASGFAWNHNPVVLCVMLAFLLFYAIDFKSGQKTLPIALIGALLTVATFMRPTTVLIYLLFLIFIISVTDGSIKQKFNTATPFLLASAIVAICPLWIILQAPKEFLLNAFYIPQLNGQWLYRVGLAIKKTHFLGMNLTLPGSPGLITITLYLYLTIFFRRRSITFSDKPVFLLASLLAIVFLIIAFVPLTMWSQYFAPPVPFLLISFAWPLLFLRKLSTDTKLHALFKIARILLAAVIFVLVFVYCDNGKPVRKLLNPQSWTPMQLHATAEDIAGKIKSPKLILTLAPLYALEGGCDIYTELSAGPFVYRVANGLSYEQIEKVNSVAPKTLGYMLEQSPPSAVIFGTEPKMLEKPIYDIAIAPTSKSWKIISYPNGPTLYLKQ